MQEVVGYQAYLEVNNMAQQQGLFTTGPSVEDLLQQRNTRALDLQRQLMQGAAQGARDPAKAQAVSFLGSSLGRALAGAMGGEDKQMEERKAAIAEQKRLRGEYLGVERGGSAEMFAFAQALSDKGLGDAARQMNTAAIARRQLELENKKADKKKAEDDLVAKIELHNTLMEKEALQDRAKDLSKSFDDNKPFQALLQSGKASLKIIELAEKQIADRGLLNKTVSLSPEGRLLVESGMKEGTPEFKAAITNILEKKNTLTTVQSPMQQVQMFSGFIQNNPQYKFAKSRLVKVDDGFDALALLREGNEKSRPLLERTVSEVYNSDTRAASEIDRLVTSGSVGRRMRDWITGGFEGTPSEATVSDYEQLLSTMDTAMRETINGVVDINAGLYGDLITPKLLESASSNLRMEPKSKQASTVVATPNVSNLGQALGTSEKPNGSQWVNGKKYLIRDGKVYASE
jgi:hypothetical protein